MLKVACALIVKDKKLLICQNDSSSDHPFLWEFPGGKINSDETVENGVTREIREELEIQIDIINTMQTVIFDYGFKEIKLYPFLCSVKKGSIKLNDHVDYKWVEFKQLENINLSGADRKLVQQNKNIEVLKKYIGK